MSAVLKHTPTAAFDVMRLPIEARNLIDHTQLLPRYLAAKNALITLTQVDEVKSIADKHAALAHYAKQIKDNSLRHYAERVYARALARIGELLEELPAGARRASAKQHGLSDGEMGYARNLAAIPSKTLARLIDCDPPASKQTLSMTGNAIRQPRPRMAHKFASYVEQEPKGRVLEMVKDVMHFWFSPGNKHCDALALVDQLTPDEAKQTRAEMQPLHDHLARLDAALAVRVGE